MMNTVADTSLQAWFCEVISKFLIEVERVNCGVGTLIGRGVGAHFEQGLSFSYYVH